MALSVTPLYLDTSRAFASLEQISDTFIHPRLMHTHSNTYINKPIQCWICLNLTSICIGKMFDHLNKYRIFSIHSSMILIDIGTKRKHYITLTTSFVVQTQKHLKYLDNNGNFNPQMGNFGL